MLENIEGISDSDIEIIKKINLQSAKQFTYTENKEQGFFGKLFGKPNDDSYELDEPDPNFDGYELNRREFNKYVQAINSKDYNSNQTKLKLDKMFKDPKYICTELLYKELDSKYHDTLYIARINSIIYKLNPLLEMLQADIIKRIVKLYQEGGKINGTAFYLPPSDEEILKKMIELDYKVYTQNKNQ